MGLCRPLRGLAEEATARWRDPPATIKPGDVRGVRRALSLGAKGYQVLSSDFEYLPKSTVLVEGGGGDAAYKFDAIYDALEGCDDVQTVFHNVEFQY